MSAASSIRSRYPLGVLVVAAIALFRAASIVAEVAEFRQDGSARLARGQWAVAGDARPARTSSSSRWPCSRGCSSPACSSVIGLLLRKRWAWVLAIITSGVILAIDLGWWLNADARYASMLLNSIAVFYLNQRDVRLALRGGSQEP